MFRKRTTQFERLGDFELGDFVVARCPIIILEGSGKGIFERELLLGGSHFSLP